MSYKPYRLVVDDITNSGELLADVDITDSVVRIRQTSNNLRFNPGHLEMLFKSGKTVSIRRDGKSPHKVNVWEDGDITVYPYRMGVPYLFTPSVKGGDTDG